MNPNPKLTVISAPSVKTRLAECLAAQATFHKGFSDLEVQLEPGAFLEAAKTLLSRATTAAEIKAAQARLASLQGEAARVGKEAAQRAIWKLSEEFKTTLNPLLVSALDVVDAQLAAAIKAEEKFFTAHELPREVTGVSSRWQTLQAELIRLRASLAPSPNQPLVRPTRALYGRIPGWFKVV